MLVEPNAWCRPREQHGKCFLAHFQRVTAQVISVELDQIEHHMNTVSSVSQRRIISKHSIPSTRHATSSPSIVQDAREWSEPGQGILDQRMGQVISGAAAEFDTFAGLAGRSPGSRRAFLDGSNDRQKAATGPDEGRHGEIKPAGKIHEWNMASYIKASGSRVESPVRRLSEQAARESAQNFA